MQKPSSSAVDDSKPLRVQRLRHLSHLLDNAIVIPGTSYRVGLDPLLGLIPGGGDTIGMLLSSAIVLEAARMGATKSVLGRMVFNIMLETVVGTIPVVGDIFDVTWKSNIRNIALLENHLKIAHPNRSRHQGFAILLLIGLFLVFVACLVGSVFLLRWLIQTIGVQ